jgi:Rrf2 family iron-sulfur cluster assembly transcriptional regulator
MIRLNKRMLFSIEAVLDIACNQGESPVRSIDITQREGIPARYLEPVLQGLVRNGILVGIRGPAGGYRLARAAEDISLGDIVRIFQAVDTQEGSDADLSGSVSGREVVHLLWIEAQKEMMRRLDAISIEELRARATRPTVKPLG